MRCSPIVALALLASTSCFTLPTSSPIYASYESHLSGHVLGPAPDLKSLKSFEPIVGA
jgi:hypothetical protein